MVKRSQSCSSAAGSCDISSYAAKLPKLKRTGDGQYDGMLATYEVTIQQCTTKLQEEPHLSLVCWAQLSSGGAQRAVAGKGSVVADKWDDSYTRIFRLPKYFWVAVIMDIEL